MKKITTFLIIYVLVTSFAVAQTDEEAVKQVVTSAYIDGIHNGGPIEDIRKGFHPSFTMLRLAKNEVKPLSIDEWIKNIEASRTKEGNNVAVKVEGKFISVTVAGTSGNVVLEIYHEGKKIFTDNLLLYKFNEGWRVVSKTYYRHP